MPQSRCEDDVADAIFAFFLLSFSFSPACTTSLESIRHSGQYLRPQGHHPLPVAARPPPSSPLPSCASKTRAAAGG